MDKRTAEMLMVGKRPTITASSSKSDYIDVFNWYNYMYDPKDGVDWIVKYLKTSKRPTKDINYIKGCYIPLAIAAIADMVNSGDQISTEYISKLENTINALLKTRPPEKKVSEGARKTVYELVSDSATPIVELVDQLIDNRKYKTNIYDEIQKFETNAKVVQHVINYFTPALVEAQIAKDGDDEQLVEGYSTYSKKSLTQYINFLNQIIDDCTRFCSNKKAAYTPKKKVRVKTKKSNISKFVYKKQHPELKLESIQPGNIIGAKTLWVYNTKGKTLTWFASEDDDGLNIKGTSITNIDPTKSITKKIRKPDIINKVIGSGKVELKKIMDGIKAKAKVPTGRINKDCILVRVGK